MTPTQAVSCEHRDAVAMLTLRRPDQLNALSTAVVAGLESALDEIEGNTDVRALVVTGEGKAFSAGADIKEFRALDGPMAFRAFLEHLELTLRRIALLPQPSVAAINGMAFGGGLELAMACDLRVAEAGAKLGVPEIKLGLLPGAGGTQRLPRLVPPAVATKMILTGDPVTAEDALRIGLVNEVTEAGRAVERALDLASSLAMRAPLALAAAKRLGADARALPLDAALELERETVALLFATEDRAEGTAAFVEKREPRFRGA
jgi:enoyl-CoA hydratase